MCYSAAPRRPKLEPSGGSSGTRPTARLAAPAASTRKIQSAAPQFFLELDVLGAPQLPDVSQHPIRIPRLTGDRAGQHGIRIKDQWRVCFAWTAQGPKDVEIVDYR